MTHKTFKLLLLSTLAIIMTGCYTQLAVIERTVPIYVSADDRVDERADEIEYFDEDSYRTGYDDAVSDLFFRDYRRKPVIVSNDYELGYLDGLSDANWKFNSSRFRYRYNSYYWDPFYYDSYWAFYVSWQWHRPYSWYGYYGYNPYNFYNYPYHHGFGWMGYGYYGRYPYNSWIVYEDYNRPSANVQYGPRSSGVSRDRQLTDRGSIVRSGDRSVTNSGRTSGVTRGTTTTRERGTITESGRANTRTSGVRTPSTNRGSSARPSGTRKPDVNRTTPTRTGSSGGVRSAPSKPSSGSRPSSGTRPRPNNRSNSNDDSFSASGSSSGVRSSSTGRSTTVSTPSRSTTRSPSSTRQSTRDNRDN